MKQHTKRLGQVFINDNNIIEKIIKFSAISNKIPIIEIGCGRGILTKALSKTGNKIHVIEIDERWLSEVKKLNLKNTTFEKADVLNVNFSKFEFSSIIANIPYQITSPLIEHLSKYKTNFKLSMVKLQPT